jgi:beta-N-acetylhexosaminidase
MELATNNADRKRLERLELAPFRAAIEAGVDSIMTAHIAVPALAPPDLPATLSSAILTDLLRKEMGFKGLVVTDALDMGGITKGFGGAEAAVRALEAGADVLLMPVDPEAALKAVVAAVENGRLTRRRIEESVVAILSAKERVGLARKRVVDLDAIGDLVGSPEASERAQEIAGRAVTLVRNGGDLIPLAAPERACYAVMVESRYSSDGQVFAQEVRRRVPKAAIASLDASMSRDALGEAIRGLPTCQSYVVAAFASVSAYRGSVGLAGELPHAVETFIASGQPVALVALGNPYLLRSFPGVTAYLATFSSVPPSEAAAVEALFGETDIRGHLPVSIPGIAIYGEGIEVRATRSAQLSNPAR